MAYRVTLYVCLETLATICVATLGTTAGALDEALTHHGFTKRNRHVDTDIIHT